MCASPANDPGETMTTTADALGALHREHAPNVLRLLVKLTHGDRETAEDLLQETMLRAWRHADSIPSEQTGQRRWLYAIARRLFIDTVRAQRVRPTVTPVLDLEWVSRAEDTTDAALASESIRHAFRRLSPDHRRVLSDLHFRGRPIEQVAQELGVPVGTVKSRAHYAMRALKSGLEVRD